MRLNYVKLIGFQLLQTWMFVIFNIEASIPMRVILYIALTLISFEFISKEKKVH